MTPIGKPLVLLAGLAGILAILLPMCRLEASVGVVDVTVLDMLNATYEGIDASNVRAALWISFGPGLLIAGIGLWGWLGRFGRLKGVLVLVPALLSTLFGFALREGLSKRVGFEPGIGLWSLVACGVLGVLGGLLLLIRPERAPAAAE